MKPLQCEKKSSDCEFATKCMVHDTPKQTFKQSNIQTLEQEISLNIFRFKE